jgi:hypothetical protein
MFQRFIKKQFVSFYKENNSYKLLKEIYKNRKLLIEETMILKSKKELKHTLKNLLEEIPQTYISTIIQSLNQGVIPTCNKNKFIEYDIESIEDIKYICINNKYTIYTSIFDLKDLKREIKEIDFIYSIFGLIDYKVNTKNNNLYILITKDKYYLIIYYKNKAIFSDILEKNNKKDFFENFENDEIIEDIENEIIDDIENLEDLENENNKNIENNLLSFIESALEEYYKKYADDFIENIIIFDSNNILDDKTIDLIKNNLLIETIKKEINILKTINEISRKNV